MYFKCVVALLRSSVEEKTEMYLLVDHDGSGCGGDLSGRIASNLSPGALALLLESQERHHLGVDVAKRCLCGTVDRDVVVGRRVEETEMMERKL